MKRDIDLYRKIVLAIEELYQPGDGSIGTLGIEGYDTSTIAEHCDWLCQAGIIKSYKPQWGDNRILQFAVGNLTHYGCEFLESVRSEEDWKQYKSEIKQKRLPETLTTLAKVTGMFAGSAMKEIING